MTVISSPLLMVLTFHDYSSTVSYKDLISTSGIAQWSVLCWSPIKWWLASTCNSCYSSTFLPSRQKRYTTAFQNNDLSQIYNLLYYHYIHIRYLVHTTQMLQELDLAIFQKVSWVCYMPTVVLIAEVRGPDVASDRKVFKTNHYQTFLWSANSDGHFRLMQCYQAVQMFIFKPCSTTLVGNNPSWQIGLHVIHTQASLR